MIVTTYDNPADEYKTIFKAMTDIIFVKKQENKYIGTKIFFSFTLQLISRPKGRP